MSLRFASANTRACWCECVYVKLTVRTQCDKIIRYSTSGAAATAAAMLCGGGGCRDSTKPFPGFSDERLRRTPAMAQKNEKKNKRALTNEYHSRRTQQMR